MIAPNAWMGECGCLIGPFARRFLAEAFANGMVEFGQFEGICERVVVRTDAYYVEAARVAESGGREAARTGPAEALTGR